MNNKELLFLIAEVSIDVSLQQFSLQMTFFEILQINSNHCRLNSI